MKKLLLAGLPVLIIFMGLPFLATLMVVMTTTAAAECRTQTSETAPTELGDLGVIDGPVGGPVKGKITMAQANIPRRSGLDGFRASMPQVLSDNPDFVTLNEANGWSLAQIEAAAPGYAAFRGREPPATQADGQRRALEARHLDQGQRRPGHARRRRQTYYQGRPVTWDRFATWVIPERSRRRRGLGHLDPPHDQPAQVPTPARATRR